jgi:DNA replication protein DnaC
MGNSEWMAEIRNGFLIAEGLVSVRQNPTIGNRPSRRGAEARGIKLEYRDLLLVDEFGVARLHEDARMVVLGIISHRFSEDRRTILTTTKSEAELTELVGGAMVSRTNSGIVVKMQGKDRRLHT